MVYLDNAATSFPKPPEVASAIAEFINFCGGSPGRASHSKSLEASDRVDEVRAQINSFLGGYGAESVCFTSNASEALNTVILGAQLPEKATILTSSLEHNSVIRPLYTFLGRDFSIERVPVHPEGYTSSDDVLEVIERELPAMVVLNHVSNVTGSILDIAPIGKHCAEKGILLIVDGSQSAGHIPINLQEMNIPVFCFTGHKGLLGPQGIGGFIIHPDWVDRVAPLKHGGTGVESSSPCQPKNSPERYEAGTLNTPGIVGLGAAIKFLEGKTHRLQLENLAREALSASFRHMNGVKIIGPSYSFGGNTIGIISIQVKDPIDLAFRLDAQYDIQVRAGLHCSPESHRALGTFPLGTVRFSLGPFIKASDIDFVSRAIEEIISECPTEICPK